MILGLLLLVSQDRSAIDRWRESIELDLPGEVVLAGVPRVTKDGALARDGEAIALVARALFAAGDESGARKLLDEARPDPATSSEVELARACLAIERDELGRALQILLVAGPEPGVRFPAQPEGWLLAGRALVRAGQGGKAAPILEKFVALAPLDVEAPAAWHMLTQIAIARRDMTRAEGLRAKAAESGKWQSFYRTRRLQVREHPESPLPRLGLAELWLAADEPARAKKASQELVEMAPLFCRGWEALGQADRRLGDADGARKAIERAIDCDPKLASAHLELARILLGQGDYGAAEARHRRYQELGGKEPLQPR